MPARKEPGGPDTDLSVRACGDVFIGPSGVARRELKQNELNDVERFMPAESVAAPEILRVKKVRFLKRLWVRISLVLLLCWIVSAAIWWWPRRTMVAVWRVNGTVFSDVGRERTIAALEWWDPAGSSRVWQNFESIYQVISWLSSDDEIGFIGLDESSVEDEWLVQLRGFPNLTGISLNAGQLGTGLNQLRETESLRGLHLKSASNRCLDQLQRLPQLENVYLWNAQSTEIGLDSLAALPKLKSLFFGLCVQTDGLLKALPELPLVESLVIQECQGFVDADLKHLKRLPNLKYLDIVVSARVGDEGLKILSRLENLETLALRRSWQQVTDDGLQSLQELKKLKKLIVLRGDLTPAQVTTLERLLPNVVIQGN